MSAPRPIFETCTPRPDVAAGTTKDEQFAADLAQVIRGTAPDEYRVPAVFFRNSYPTRGMKELRKAVCRRLSGRGGEIGSVFRLDTQYGGGKTHGLIALVHAVKGMPGVGTSPSSATRRYCSVSCVSVVSVNNMIGCPSVTRLMGPVFQRRLHG